MSMELSTSRLSLRCCERIAPSSLGSTAAIDQDDSRLLVPNAGPPRPSRLSQVIGDAPRAAT